MLSSWSEKNLKRIRRDHACPSVQFFDSGSFLVLVKLNDLLPGSYFSFVWYVVYDYYVWFISYMGIQLT